MTEDREQMMREALEIANDTLDDEYKFGSLLRTDVRYSIFKTLYDEIMSEPEPAIDWKARAEKAEKLLAEAVGYLRQGKQQFTPHTTNSDVDYFIKRNFKEAQA